MSSLLAERPAHVPDAHVADIDIYAPPGLADDYHAAWAALQRDHPPLVWTPRNEGHWIALSGEVMAEVQADWQRFSNRVIVLPKSVGEMHQLIPTTIDPPAHRPFRVLLNDNLKPSAVRGIHDNIRAVAVELIEAVRADGRCDFTHHYARAFPIRIFLALVDLPASDAERLRLWAESMTRPEPEMPFEEARAAFFAYLDPVIRARRASPGGDMLSNMLHADMEGRTLTHDEALALATQVLIAGMDTVVNFLSFAMLALARDPALRAAVRSHPRGTMAVTNEFFRRFGLVTIAREVVADMDFHGVPLRAGDMVAIPTVVHGIDPAANPDPMRIDVNRVRARHSTFGNGPHQCPGQELARAEVAITVEEWLDRIGDFAVAPDSDLTNRTGIVGNITRLCLEWEPR